MEEIVARAIALCGHVGQRDRVGESVIEHVQRVAGGVPEPARATAWLHDLLERTDTDPERLTEQGLGRVEREALGLLTRGAGESFELHVLRIVHAPGPAGTLARTVKLADLEDHILRERAGSVAAHAPPYGWARRHLLARAAVPRLGTEPLMPLGTMSG
jgi:hypothetical protein